MKKCPYCGAEYSDDAVRCAIDETPFKVPKEPASELPLVPEAHRPEYALPPLSAADQGKDLVTLLSCRTLLDADLVVSRLRAAGIEAFLPDESVMQTIGLNLNAFGYVRVQIAPRDYDTARELLKAGA